MFYISSIGFLEEDFLLESWLESFVYYFHRGFSRFTYHRNLNILFYYFGEVSFESLVIERSLSVTSSNFFLEDRISVQIYSSNDVLFNDDW